MAEEALLSAVMTILMQKSADFVLREFRIAQEAKEDCQKLCRILPPVQAIVEDAERRSRTEPAVKEWMHSLRVAALEAEDVLDELKYDAIRMAIETEIQSERMAHLCLLGCSQFKSSIRSYFDGKKLKRILGKIDAVLAEMNAFGFLNTRKPELDVPKRPWSHSYVIESTVFGRSDDLEKIVGIVLDQANRERVAVLPIVGMGGLGKTTLTQLVYNNSVIQSQFELKLWVCVSDEFDVARLAKSILDVTVCGNSQLPLENMEVVQRRLHEVLTKKRYFLVLDDVWNENRNKWEQLKLLLDCGSLGSVVIVTTRSKKVASIVGTISPYELQGLNEDELWDIFRQRAFGIDGDEKPEFVEIGKQLMKCCGSPLVATTLGGLMSYKEEKEWVDVLESSIWDHMAVKNEIMPVLKLSYENLPSHVKMCFAFCAVYPKDFEMERNTLIELWMTHSYIPLEENMEMEDKGIEIFNELVWRGLFQFIRKDDYNYNIIFKMHDLIHDLAQFVAGNECCTTSDLDQRSDVFSKKRLHVSSCTVDSIYSLVKECHSIRTILLLPSGREERSRDVVNLPKANTLRALSWSDTSVKELHVEPKTLMHLRYLDLSCCNWLRVLPESICTLYNLQILKLSGCNQLEILPKGMRRMHNLRHFYIHKCRNLKRMPAGLSKLKNLQTLTKYVVDRAVGCGIEELKDLNLGGLLELHGLDNLRNEQEAKLANLILKKNLIMLELWWSENPSDEVAARDELEGLEPCQGLESLSIKHYNGIQFSAWMHNLRNLTSLLLVSCRRCTTLPTLWQLPLLKVLKLWHLDNLEYICSGVTLQVNMFPKLQELNLQDLPSLKGWQENDPTKFTSLVLPQLLFLRIEDCPRLDALPSCPLLSVLVIQGVRSDIPSSVVHSLKNNGVKVHTFYS